MKEYSIDHKRNIALAGHHASGKTSLVEAVLFSLGVIDRMGRTEDGNTFCDYTDEEKARHLSVYATLVQTEWKKTRINALDLPGFPDFVGEIKGALQVVDGAVIVLDGCAGVEVETERAWDIADRYNLPRIAVINKLDRERSDFNKVLEQTGRVLKSIPCVPFQLRSAGGLVQGRGRFDQNEGGLFQRQGQSGQGGGHSRGAGGRSQRVPREDHGFRR
jgi:elongation factor G